MTSEDFKRVAAEAALAHVEPGMRLGLGTGTTAAIFLELLGEKVAKGFEVIGVPTSEQTREIAERHNIPLTTLKETPALDLTIDGADEVDPDLNLIKGGGGALLREKIVAFASARMIVIADASKRVETLGAFPLPIEVVPFGKEPTLRAIRELIGDLGVQGDVVLRRAEDGCPVVTDSGHVILDGHFSKISDPKALAASLTGIPGVVEHGLFLGLAGLAIIAGPNGVEQVEPRGRVFAETARKIA